MTITAVDAEGGATPHGHGRARWSTAVHKLRKRSGQIVVSQAALAGWLAAYGQGPLPAAAVGAGGIAVLAAAWIRLRGRWGYQWLATAAGYLARRRALDAQTHPAALLDWVRPGARVVADECDGEPAGIIEDLYARTALLELGQPDTLVSDVATPLPPLRDLLVPGVRVHLVVTAAVADPGPGAPATNYRELTEGGPGPDPCGPARIAQDAPVPARQRVVLAVQALGGEGTAPADLARTLHSAIRRLRRRLRRTVGVRLLAEPAVHAVLADLTHHDGAHPVRESWTGVHVGGLWQATYRLPRWPTGTDGSRFIARVLALPTAATTIGLTVGPDTRAALAVRLAAPSRAALTVAAQALQRLLDSHAVAAWPCDGAQVPALAATLPLGDDHSGLSGPAHPTPPPQPPVGGAGLVLGVDRHGAAVAVRLLRPEPTTVLLVGGVRAAQLLTLRALALGVQVVVRSGRPPAWEPFVRAVSAPGQPVAVMPPGHPTLPFGAVGSALRPQLVVDDAPPAAGPVPVPAAPWRTVLTVRDELTPADVAPLARADLAVLQPLHPAEAALATQTLGLGDTGEWLTRIRPDMVGLVHRRTVRWALLATTRFERQLLGTVARG